MISYKLKKLYERILKAVSDELDKLDNTKTKNKSLMFKRIFYTKNGNYLLARKIEYNSFNKDAAPTASLIISGFNAPYEFNRLPNSATVGELFEYVYLIKWGFLMSAKATHWFQRINNNEYLSTMYDMWEMRLPQRRRKWLKNVIIYYSDTFAETDPDIIINKPQYGINSFDLYQMLYGFSGPKLIVLLAANASTVKIDLQNSTTLMILSNLSWRISYSGGWFTVYPTQGKGNEAVSVTATGGSSGSTGTITLSSTEDSRVVTVNVKYGSPYGDPYMYTIPSSITVDSRKQTTTFRIVSNVAWQASSNVSWCSISSYSPSSGSDTMSISFDIQENTNKNNARTGTITIRSNDTQTVNIPIQQTAKSSVVSKLSVSPTSVTIDADGGTAELTVSCNVKWTASSNYSFCTVSPTSGSKSGKVTLTFSKNTESSQRNATITFSARDANSVIVSATQKAAIISYLRVQPTIVTKDYKSGSKQLYVQSNTYWSISNDSGSWLTVNPTAGQNDGTIELSFSENTSYTDSRTAVLTFYGVGVSEVSATITQRKHEDSPSSDIDVYLSEFSSYVDVPSGGTTYNYLQILYDEAYSQFYNETSLNGITGIHKQANFPVMYSWGTTANRDAAFKTMVGWLFALQLSELNPKKRTSIFKVGYEMGGYDRYSNIYGYEFKSDPNYARIAAGAIYVAMRGKLKPDIATMRSESGGYKYSKTLQQLYDTSSIAVGENDFYIDLREFMPTAPGPYAPGYTTRPDNTYPNEQKDSYKNLQKDRDIHEDIITKYNLDNNTYLQMTVQAIADKDAASAHLFGPNRQTEHYSFHPVFGEQTIGIELPTTGSLADFTYLAILCSSAARIILQSADVSPKQYGRLRPGCSWSQEARKNSDTDNRRNILTKFEIEDGDGNPTGYYNSNGTWTQPSVVSSPEEYEEEQRNALWANSYPSGHSSGITGGAMVLMELMPERTDKILKEMNQFSVNRTIARYHWTSDTINGRVLGTAQNAVGHASSDYDTLLEAAGGGG